MLNPHVVAESERFIRAAIETKHLEQVDPGRQITERPAIVLGCCDFLQLERFNHCRQRIARKAQELKLHGGGLLLDPDSPANHEYDHLPVIRHQVSIAVTAKGTIKDFVSFVDWRCGLAVHHGLSIQNIFRSAIRGKQLAKQPGGFLEGWQVRLLFYLHDFSFLDPNSPFIREHPEAEGFTFYFGAKSMLRFIETWTDPVRENMCIS